MNCTFKFLAPRKLQRLTLDIAEWETRGHSTYKAYKFKAPIKKTLTMQETVSNQGEINTIYIKSTMKLSRETDQEELLFKNLDI